MKKTIYYLLIAHAVSTAIAYVANASIYTLMMLYACQAAILLIVLTVEAWQLGDKIYKFMSLFQSFIFAIFIATIFFFLIMAPRTPLLMSDGTERVLELGKISIFPLITGSIAFLIDYIYDGRNNKNKQLKSSLMKNVRSFFILFSNVAALILILFTAATFSSSRTSILIIAAIKIALDVGLLLLAAGLSRLDGPISKLATGKITFYPIKKH